MCDPTCWRLITKSVMAVVIVLSCRTGGAGEAHGTQREGAEPQAGGDADPVGGPRLESSEAANDSEDAVAPATAGHALIRQAFELTQRAKTEEELTTAITLCGDGIARGASDAQTKYAEGLMAWAHNKRGELYASREGREADALREFSRAAELNPKLWRAMHNRAITYAGQGKSTEALDDFNKTIELNQNYPNAWFNRGELRYQLRQFEEALADYDRAVQLAPRDAGFRNSRGHALYQLGRLRPALDDFNLAARLDPKSPDARVNRADIYRELGQYAPAAGEYREAVRLGPQNGRALRSAAWFMSTCPDARFRDSRMAMMAAEKAVELDGETPAYLDTLAAAYASAGQFDSAQEVQAEAIGKAAKEDAASYKRRLEFYKRQRPYREGPASPRTTAAAPRQGRAPAPRQGGRGPRFGR